jgi:hypothetical protein
LIEVDEIHRTQGFTGEAIEDGVVFSAARETMNRTGADICNQQLFRRFQRDAVRRSGYAPDDRLSSGGIESGYSPPIVGDPKRAVRFGHDAFWPAEIVTNETDILTADGEMLDG